MRAYQERRYEAVAAFIADLVAKRVLEPGEKAPSLRELSQGQCVSLSTAMRAYQLLEERGILEVRPQSGHYIAGTGAAGLDVPNKSKPARRASPVRISHRVLQLLEYAADPAFVPLGCAIPSPDLLAAEGLDRLLARAARTRGRELNTYSTVRGDMRLRLEIARRAARRGHTISPDDIAITCGCTEALHLALKAVTRPGDLVAIESPTYFGLLHALEMLDLKAVEIPTDAVSGIDPEELALALERNRIAACLLSSSFNNPLGCSVPDENRTAILRLLAMREVPLIEDDTYGELFFGRDPVPSRIFSAANSVHQAPEQPRQHADRATYDKGLLILKGELAKLSTGNAFAALLRPLRRMNWFVYTKRPFASSS
jgi:DNA-binding transcriptional MocR family regulator